MSERKGGRKESADATPAVEKRMMGIQIEEELAGKLKAYAVEDDRSLAYMIRVAIKEYVAKRDAERKAKQATVPSEKKE